MDYLFCPGGVRHDICKPEEGWYGQPKYCYKKQYTLF